MNEVSKIIYSKAIQYTASIGGGLLVAFEASIPFFVPCFLSVIVDVWSAYCLGKRVHKKHPERSDGKFKSEYKYRMLYTMIVVLVGIVIASYVDVHVIKDGNTAVSFIIGMFLFYESWSVLENWSSENDNKLALLLQMVMINKAERHFNVDLSILKKEKEGKDEYQDN